jgi:VWFA-related protein
VAGDFSSLMRKLGVRVWWALALAAVCAVGARPQESPRADAQSGGREAARRREVRTVTIPVTIRLPEKAAAGELQYLGNLEVFEDGERQEILSTRAAPRSPLTLAVLIQDDLAAPVGNDIRGLAKFIRSLPPESRVMVAYLRAGSLQVRQKFTTDLERAANSLRIPASSTSVGPSNPFTQTRDALKRFEAQPVGRRALLLVSDGVDASRGIENSSPGSSLDLQRAIAEAQRRSVAVYSIYAPTVWGGGVLAGNGQGALNKLSSETGGRAFFQGTGAPVSFDPFLRDLDRLLSRQFALTYLSTNPGKGFHRLRVVAELDEGEVYHPSGYTR